MAINLPSARLAFVAGLATFICISFVLYNFVDSNATIRTNALKRNIDSIETLRAKVNDLEAKLLRNEDLVKDFKGRLGRYQEIGKAHEAVENDNGQGAQIPQPQENNGVHVGFNVSGAQQCPVGQVVSDIQMLDVYDSIPFDNPNGGVWKQGFEIKYDKEKIKSEKRLDVIVIPHSHCDPGWLKTFEGYYEEQTKNILDGMAKNLGEKPDMKFIYAEMSFFELWWSQQTEDTKEKVRGYLQSGQFEIVTGGWVMTDEANAHLYSILMELFEGHEFLQTQLGFKPRSHWSIDPFGLSSVLAHVMKSANLTHMAVQRVHYSIKKYLAERKQLEFRWRQLFAGNSARTDIRTHMFPFYSYDVPHTCGPDPSICCQFDFRRLTSYGCPWGKPPKRITNTNVAARAEILADQYRKKAQLYDLNVLLIPLGDDFRYDTQTEWTDQYENYQKLFAYMNGKKELNINAKFGTLNDYFQLMDKRLSEQPETPKQDLPILSGDFFTYADRDDHYWSGYFTSRPFYKHMDRTVGHFVRAADILFSFSNWKATKNNEENASLKQLYNRLVEARRALSLFQHHDGVTGTARKDVVVDYGRKMLKAIEDSKTIISQATAYLFGLSEQDKQQVKVDTEHFLDLLPKHKPIEPVSTILIQNSLGFERNEVHCIAVKSPKIKIRKSESSEVPKQQIQPIIIVKDGKITIEKDQLELCFVANIPALGISRYELVQGEDNANFVKIQASEGVETSNFSPFEATKFDGEILLSNEKTSASFDSNTALLKSVKPKDDISLDMNMEFVFYGARGKNRSRDPGGDSLSGAYLFLPNGKAKPLENNKNSFVKVSGPIRQSIHILGPQEAQILQEIRLDQNEDFLDIINHVDITTQSNFEVAMRLKSTDFTNNEEFYTELNAQQMIRRKRYEKIPLQGNFYPMPGAAFLQTKEKRWSLLGRQALGVASLEPGWMEVMLDRRLDQDDDRGLAEDVHDNKLTESRFRLLIEKTPSQSSTDSKKIDYHSVRAHHYSLKLHYPLISMSISLDESSAKSLPAEWKPLKTDLPCDVHLLAFRNFGEKTVYSDGNRNTVPKNQGALILQRLGIGCDAENVEGKCKPSDGKLLLTDYLVDSPKKASLTSLTSMDELHSVNGLQVQLEPFDLKTVRIEF